VHRRPRPYGRVLLRRLVGVTSPLHQLPLRMGSFPVNEFNGLLTQPVLNGAYACIDKDAVIQLSSECKVRRSQTSDIC
jgi:hypothetical protein